MGTSRIDDLEAKGIARKVEELERHAETLRHAAKGTGR
jgi:hypothetical protein